MAEYVRRVPIRWNDRDPARIACHAHAIRWMDEGFREMAEARGVGVAALLRGEA